MNTLLKLLVIYIISLAAGTLFAIPVIRIFTRLKCGQEIRDEGPRWHSSKSGTPTMGGVIFIFIGSVAALFATKADITTVMLVFLSVSFGIIGFVDDFIKVRLKRNMGLTEAQKFILQIVAALLFVWLLRDSLVSIELVIPFTKISVSIGWWYLPLSVITIISTVNAVNLADGLDGLAASTASVVIFFFSLVAFLLDFIPVTIFGAAILGSVAAFWLFNKYPAKIFMGDTGALFLGAVISGMAILTGTPLFIIISGGVFVFEVLSDIIQVIGLRVTGKRPFKMTPFHHHLEMIGMRETKVVTIFFLTTLLLSIIAYGGFLIYIM